MGMWVDQEEELDEVVVSAELWSSLTSLQTVAEEVLKARSSWEVGRGFKYLRDLKPG